VVYNNYPWPAVVTDKQRAAVEAAAQAVLDARAQFPTATLADLYDPLTMPAELHKARQALDRAVDRCYRPEPFSSDRHRVEYLCARSLPFGSALGCPKPFGPASRRSQRLGFALYEKITAPLVAAAKPMKRRR
jgi:hypothetical protein